MHHAQVTERVLAATVDRLWHHGVLLEGCLLKPQMVIPGADCTSASKPTPEQIAEHTVAALRRWVRVQCCLLREWELGNGLILSAWSVGHVYKELPLCFNLVRKM